MARIKRTAAPQPGRLTQLDKAQRAWERRQYKSLKRCAESFSVPYSSLWCRVKLPTKPAGEAHESQQLFSLAEEKGIVKWITNLDDRGFPVRVGMVRDLATRLLDKKHSTHKLGKNFISRFLNRHPSLTTKFSNQVHKQRALASEPRIIGRHFDRLRQVLRKRNITENCIYNMDEKGILMGIGSRVKVICRRGRRNPTLIHGT